MHDHELPPPVQMVQMLAGFQVSQALYVAAALAVPDHLTDASATVETLAEKTGADAPSLHRLLRTLASVGVFTEPEPGRYALTPLGETLASDRPGSMRELAIMWMETHYGPFAELLHTVRTGEPAAQRSLGRPFFEWLSGQPAHAARFTAAMANLTDGIKAGALASLPLRGQTVVDIGGADGAVLATVLAGHPEMRGVLFDLPHVVAAAPQALAARGVLDRVRCVAGDFFESVPAGGDTYLFSLVLHDWDDEQAHRILRNVHTAGGPGTRLNLVEFVVPAGDTPHMSKMIDLTMLGMLTGKERTEPEWHDLLTTSGFRDIQVIATQTPLSVIHAVAQ